MRSTNRYSKVRLIANKDQWNTCVLSYSWYQLDFMCLWAWWDSAHTRIISVPHGNKDNHPNWAHKSVRGNSCRGVGSFPEFPGARPVCRGTPETPADNLGVHFEREPSLCARREDVGSGENRSVCAEVRLRFGREPSCVRRSKTLVRARTEVYARKNGYSLDDNIL